MSSNSRTKILSSIRNAQSSARLPQRAPAPDFPLEVENSPSEASDRLRRLTAELDSLGVDCYVEKDGEAIVRRLALLLEDRSILSWDVACLPYSAGKVLHGRTVRFGKDDSVEQAKMAVGLTGCDAAIAETGTLVLISSEGQCRAASLLPFEHIAIIRRSDIYSSMAEFFEKRKGAVAAASYINFITGPSRTADIELSLTLGVHGPGKMTVVIGP